MRDLFISLVFILSSAVYLHGQINNSTQTQFRGTFTWREVSAYPDTAIGHYYVKLADFNDQTGQYLASDIDSLCTAWDNLGGRWDIVQVDSATIANAWVLIKSINPVYASPFGIGFVSRETSGTGLSMTAPDNSTGISPQLQSRIESHNMILIDGILTGIIGDSITSFFTDADNGALQEVESGDTLRILGGYGINTTASASDTITVEADTTQLATLSDVANAGFVVDADSGTPQTISSGDTLQINSGWGVNTTVGATGVVTVAGDSTQVATQSDIAAFTTGPLTSGRIPRATGTYTLSDGVLRDDGALLALGGATVSGYSFYDYSTGAWRLATGTTAQRPTGQAGALRYNSTGGLPEFHNGTQWSYTAPAAGTFTSTRVPFANANGQLTDNANFVYDATNTRIGLGITPIYQFHTRLGINGGVFAGFENSNNTTTSRAGIFAASKTATDYVFAVAQAFSPSYTDPTYGGTYVAGNAVFNRYTTGGLNGKLIFANLTNGGTLASLPIEFHIGNSSSTISASTLVATITNTQLITKNITSSTANMLYDDAVPSFSVWSSATTDNRGYNAFQNSGNKVGIAYSVFKSRGTKASPTVVQSGDAIGGMIFSAYNGSAYMFDAAYINSFVSGAPSAGKVPTSIGFVAGDTTSYDVDFLMHSGGNVGVGASGNGKFTTTVNTPPRLLTVYGEARITDLTTDTPTRIVGADADGDLSAETPGFGLAYTGGVLQVDSTKIATQSDLASVSVTTLYTGDGTIATDRTVTLASDKTLTISGTTPDLPGYLFTEEKGYSSDWDTWGNYRLISTDYYFTNFVQGILNYDSTVFLRISAGDQIGDHYVSLQMDGVGNLSLTGLDDTGTSAGLNLSDNATLGGYGARLAGGTGVEFDADTGGKFVYQVNNSTKATLDATGLGINDTSPEKSLDVGGMGKFRQLSGQDNSVTIGTNANMGTGRSASITDAQSSDVAGRFSFTSGTTLTAGEWVTLTWGTSFDNPPAVVLMPENANAASIVPYLYVVPSTTGCSIVVNVTGAPYEGLTFEFNYIVIQGK